MSLNNLKENFPQLNHIAFVDLIALELIRSAMVVKTDKWNYVMAVSPADWWVA